MKKKLVAVVGMAGSGKTEAAFYFKKKGFFFVRFGQITLDEVMKRGLEVNEKNERMIREELRKKYGMAAYAILNLPKFREGLKKFHVVGDDLMSWEEYLFLKKEFGEDLIIVAIYASSKIRYQRLKRLKLDEKAVHRPFSEEEARSRDKAEIENLHKAGPIAMADYTIINEATVGELHQNLEKFLEKFGLYGS